MLSGNGTIDYSVEAHTLDAHKTSTAHQESTTRNIHGSVTKNLQYYGRIGIEECSILLHYIVKYIEGYIKVILETETLLPDNLVFTYLPLSLYSYNL